MPVEVFTKKENFASLIKTLHEYKPNLSLFPLKTIAMNVWIQVAILGAICFFSFFIHLDAHDVDLMEARNFVTAREMVTNGTWLIPTMNGEIRIAKPPLPTWITAIARIAGGNVDNNVTMRLPASIMASLLVFSLWGLMHTLSPDRWLPIVTASILATSVLVIDMGRRGSWDIYCHSFMMTAIWALAFGLNKKATAFGVFAFVGMAFAFSFMSKGPVSFYTLLIPFLIGYICAFGLDTIKHKWKELLLAMVLFSFFSSIWPAFIYFQHPDLLTSIATHEITSWSNRHVRPFYFYAHFAIYIGVWAPILIAGLIKPYASRKIELFGSYRFILTWLIISLLLLSILPEKKERYLLPAIIPMAVMAGYLFRYLIQAYAKRQASPGDNRLVVVHSTYCSIIALTAPVIIFHFGVNKNLISPTAGIGWSIIFILTAVTVLILGIKKSVLNIFIISLALVCLINLSILPTIFLSPLYRDNHDYRSLREVRSIDSIKGLSFYSMDKMNMKQVWDLGKIVRTWNYKTEALPINKLPIVVFSDFDPTSKISAQYFTNIDVKILDRYKYHPKDPNRLKYLALICPKGKSKKKIFFFHPILKLHRSQRCY